MWSSEELQFVACRLQVPKHKQTHLHHPHSFCSLNVSVFRILLCHSPYPQSSVLTGRRRVNKHYLRRSQLDYYPFSVSSSHTRSCHSSSPQLSTFASLGCIIRQLHKSVCRSRPRSGFLPFRGNLSFLCSH